MLNRVRRRLSRARRPRTIVTGASKNHGKPLRNLLRSLRLSGVDVPIIVYDLGLDPKQHERLRANRRVELRTFPFDKYPPYFDINVAAGEYAWKPVIITDVARERGGSVLWLDAGDVVYDDLERVWTIIERDGVYTPQTRKTIGDWTHPGTLAALGADDSILDLPNRDGSICGFATWMPQVATLLDRWRACALDRDCIAPAGSSRANHRQDQAVLSVLVTGYDVPDGGRLIEKRLGISSHKDNIPPADLEHAIDRLRRGLPAREKRVD